MRFFRLTRSAFCAWRVCEDGTEFRSSLLPDYVPCRLTLDQLLAAGPKLVTELPRDPYASRPTDTTL